METLALFNSKGGVGKTASAVNFSFLAAREGKRVLIWDLDPQSSATFYYQISPRIKGGAKKLVKKKHGLEDAIQSTNYDSLDIIPADFSERHLDIILDDMKKSQKRLKQMTEQLTEDYDLLFIDPPPGFSLLSENIFNAATVILMPMIPTTLSLRTYEQIAGYFRKQELDVGLIRPFFNMVDARKKLHRETIEEYGSKNHFFTNWIPYSSEVEKMGEHCKPLPAYSKRSKAVLAFQTLWGEIKQKLSI